MKKFLLLIFFLISLRLFAQTNVYHPFPDSNAIWTWQVCVGPPPMCASNPYFLNGDTIVNSIEYHKLYAYSPSPTIIGGIRNDIISKKTYFICFNSNIAPNCNSHITEKILYDFSAGINDTVFYGTCGIAWKVMSIDSIQLLDGTYRKRFRCGGLEDVIEGIGNNGNLICGSWDGMAYLDLLCFQKNGTIFYTSTPSMYNSNPNPCITVGMQEQNATFGLTISPNPTTGIFKITSSGEFEFSVYDVFGREVCESTSQPINQSASVDLSFEPKGIYFVRIKTEEQIISQKIVLQ